MELVRGGGRPVDILRAYGSQIHPVFMLPPLGASWFGGILATRFSVVIGVFHMIAIFCAVYTAHLKDGYVDFYIRNEDDTHPLTPKGCLLGIIGSFLVFLCVMVLLWFLVDIWIVFLTLPTWFIGYFHAPQLDMNPATSTVGYPFGIGLAILGGFYSQMQLITVNTIAFSVVFFIVLCGVKIIDDIQDYKYDLSISKQTVAVVLGKKRAWILAYILISIGIVTIFVLAIVGLFPPSTIIAGIAFGLVAGFAAYTTRPEPATRYLIRGSYIFLILLAISVLYQPYTAVF